MNHVTRSVIETAWATQNTFQSPEVYHKEKLLAVKILMSYTVLNFTTEMFTFCIQTYSVIYLFIFTDSNCIKPLLHLFICWQAQYRRIEPWIGSDSNHFELATCVKRRELLVLGNFIFFDNCFYMLMKQAVSGLF